MFHWWEPTRSKEDTESGGIANIHNKCKHSEKEKHGGLYAKKLTTCEIIVQNVLVGIRHFKKWEGHCWTLNKIVYTIPVGTADKYEHLFFSSPLCLDNKTRLK